MQVFRPIRRHFNIYLCICQDLLNLQQRFGQQKKRAKALLKCLLARSLCHFDHFYATGDEIGEHGKAVWSIVVQVFAADGEQGQLTHELFVLTASTLCINDDDAISQSYSYNICVLTACVLGVRISLTLLHQKNKKPTHLSGFCFS